MRGKRRRGKAKEKEKVRGREGKGSKEVDGEIWTTEKFGHGAPVFSNS